MYHISKAKICSKEWLTGERMNNDRKNEYERCRILLQKEKSKFSQPQDMPDDIKALFRHTQTLKKEIELDQKERGQVLSSLQYNLMQALNYFISVLTLSTDINVNEAFQLVNLWLNNSDKSSVNEYLKSVLTTIPVYKFLSLSYQIFSRLDEDPVAGKQSSH
jgi:hypothetical protein